MNKKIKNKIVPKLRFSEFRGSGEWEEKSIQKFIDDKIIISHLDGNHGELYPRAEEFSQIGIPYISANDFITGIVDFKKCKYLPVERALQFKKGIAKDKDILFAHNATVGPVAKLTTDYPFVVLSTTATYFRCDITSLSNDFLKYALTSSDFVSQYTRVMSQSTRNQVPITTQRKFNLQLPRIAEQQKIANCLSSLEELITTEIQKLEALKAHKKGLMQELFPADCETVPKSRFKEFEGSGEWEEKVIGKIAKVTTGGKDTQNKIDSGLYPFFVRSQTVERINSYSYDGEAILTSGDGVGVGKNFHYIKGKFDFHQRVYCIYDFSKNISGLFVYLYFSEHFYSRVTRMSAKNSVDSVRMGMISEMPILLPSFKEQEKIADCLSSLNELITAQMEKIEELKRHKKGLMQGLFPKVDILNLVTNG